MRNKLVFLLFLLTFGTVAVAWQTRDNSLTFGDGQTGNKTVTIQTDAVTDPAITVNTTGDHFEFNKPLDSVDIDSPDIDGGTIDGATIGGTTPGAGNFSTVDIDGGTIDGTTIGGATPAAGSFTTADIDGGTIDGATIGGTTPGAGTFSSMTATTADIDGGTIDGTTIGGTTPGAGNFSTVDIDDGTIDNVDINLGTAANDQKLVLSKNTTTNLDALTREQGSVYYDTTTDTIKFDDGTVLQEVGTGSGGSGVATGVDLGINPNANVAVDNSGTDDVGDWIDSASGTTTTRTTTAAEIPLSPRITTAIKVSFAAGTSDYVRYRFRVPPAARNRKLGVYWYQLPDSNYVSQTANVEIYNYSDNYVSDEAEVVLSIDNISGDSLIPDADDLFSFEFDANDREYYEMRIINNGATTGFLGLNQVTITPDPDTVTADVVGVWTDYTQTFTNGPASTTVLYSQYKQIGDSVHIRLNISGGASGSGSQLGLDWDIPNTTPVINSGNSIYLGGLIDTVGIQQFHIGVWDGVSTFNIFQDNGTNTATALAGSSFTATRDLVYEFSVPVAEWAGTGTVNLGAPKEEYLFNTSGITSAGASDTTSFGYGQACAAIGSIDSATANSTTTMRVRSKYPIRKSDYPVLLIDPDNSGQLLPVGQLVDVVTYMGQSTSVYGVGLDQVNETDIDVRFGNMGRRSNNATYAGAGLAWAGVAAGRWCVKIIRGSGLAGFANASIDVAGLVFNSEWQSCTVTGSLTTNATYTGFCRRERDTLKVRARIAFSGATDSGSVDITVPLSKTIDTTKIPSPTVGVTPIESKVHMRNDGVATFIGDVIYQSSTSVRLHRLNDNGTGESPSAIDLGAGNPFTVGASDFVEIMFEVPILEWDE